MNDLIVGIGEALWDVLPDRKSLGGAPANFAYHVSQFGLHSCVVSAVGNDELGHEIIESFASRKLHCQLASVPYDTGTVQVGLNEIGVPCYTIEENVAWDNIPFTPELEELAHHTRAVCFGSLAQRSAVSSQTINRFLDTMPDGEKQYKIFDINLRQNFYTKKIISNSLHKCNILKINDEELLIVSRMFGYSDIDMENCCETILEKYKLEMIILTCGNDGSYVFTPNNDVSFIETPEVDVADTVGAGDSFTAAFIASILKGKSVSDAHRIAVNVSAYVCTQDGATPVLPKKLLK